MNEALILSKGENMRTGKWSFQPKTDNARFGKVNTTKVK